jgi:glycosyltransferase involved in cell wall biosynthesis
MKILHVSTPLTWRGGEQQLAYLLEELKEKSVEQTVLCAVGSDIHKFCLKNKIACYTFNRRNLRLVPASMINAICRNDNISLIHAHDSHSHTASLISALLFGNTVPLIVSRRTIFPVGRNWLSRFKYNHSSVSRILCVSEKIKEKVSNSIRDCSKVVTVYSGIDVSRFKNKNEETFQISNLGTNLSHPFIGNIAAITEEKDYFTFVDTAEAYYKTSNQGTFFIIGDGPYRKKIERYIEEKGLKDKIVLTGFLNNIAAIIKQLDCLLFTSHSEGLGTSILDAMACYIPVVATRTGGIPEIVLHDYTGLLAPVKNAGALAECLQKVNGNSLYRKMLTNNAYAHVNNFNKQKMAMQTYDIYLQVLYEKSLRRVPAYQASLFPS